MKNSKKLLVTCLAVAISHVASAQDAALSQSMNNVWTKVQIGLMFVIVLGFVVGGIHVYLAKSNGQGDEFKKILMRYVYGIIFLFVMLGSIQMVKSFAQSSLSTVSF